MIEPNTSIISLIISHVDHYISPLILRQIPRNEKNIYPELWQSRLNHGGLKHTADIILIPSLYINSDGSL